MSPRLKKWTKFVLRWGIAVAGIYWVVVNTSIRDQVLVLDESNRPHPFALAVAATEDSPAFKIKVGDSVRVVHRDQVVNEPDRKEVVISESAGREQRVQLLGLDIEGDINHDPVVARLLVADSPSHPGRWVSPGRVVGGFELKVPHPRVEEGVASMLRQANPWLLWAAVVIFPLTFILTSIRWHRLLHALDIPLTLWRTFVLNMVGCFYNTCIPAGSTGGDVLKAYYAAKHTHHGTRAVMSVLIDRIIGLLALIIMGGTIAAGVYFSSEDRDDPAAVACRGVAIMGAGIILATMLGLFVFFHGRIRRLLRLDMLLRRLPAQEHVQHAVEVMAIYRQRPWLILWALTITFPVHVTVVVSAMLAGRSLGLPLSSAYYFVVVPVIVLVGAIPISPQGLGVMEFLAVKLTERQGATVGEALALTMWVRMVQIFWNLTGGVFVLRGSYRTPTRAEQEAMEADETAPLPTDPDALEAMGGKPPHAPKPLSPPPPPLGEPGLSS